MSKDEKRAILAEIDAMPEPQKSFALGVAVGLTAQMSVPAEGIPDGDQQ